MKVWLILMGLCLLSTIGQVCGEDSSFEVGSFNFTPPKSWESVKVKSPMRKAHLLIRGDTDKENAEVVFFHFQAGDGGSVKENISRWVSQFKNVNEKDIVVTQIKMNQTPVMMVSIATGTFLSGMPGSSLSEVPDFGLRGAILEGPKGNVFIKMTGSSALVLREGGAFEEFIKTAVLKSK
ncbi:MAG: hypothetical protein SGI71_07775 [Verrucomicrobiota bacterium]|nr:hypothetical protein [Verrucomicrobiota bacterium]